MLTALSDDEGISLVELLVAFTVLMIALAGTAAVLISVLEVNRQSEERVAASNVADQELDRARSHDFLDLEAWIDDPPDPEAVAVDGLDYTVRRWANWVTLEQEGSSCEAPDSDGPTHVEVVVEIDGPSLAEPHRSQTMVAPSVGDLDPNRGHIGVLLRDRDGDPQVGERVTIDRGAQQHTQLTDTDGCAFFGYIDIGSWTVEVPNAAPADAVPTTDPVHAALVSRPDVPAPPAEHQDVGGGEVRTSEFWVDEPATATVTAEGELGGQLVPTPLPDAFPVVFRHAELNDRLPFTFDQGMAINGFWPYPADHSVWIGENQRPTDDPDACLPEGAAVPATLEPGEATAITVPFATVEVVLGENPGQGEGEGEGEGPTRTVRAERPDDWDCGEDSLEVVELERGESELVALPYGPWTFSTDPSDHTDVTTELAPGRDEPEAVELEHRGEGS
ncbi:type IV pilus modification PilV family protein [Egibacter rhizosphaerae]|uniref:type IV pilus modification PilV family protein n=1 Tax=Egibacter rhizosphaerae TaxID=1670831 RepID=UPI0013F14E55|nr:hypothetical protein [Egibacter rhizosphaerae]